MTVEVGILISAFSVSFAIYFGLKSNRRIDLEEVEKKTIERTETNLKLDEVVRIVSDIKTDIISTKKSLSSLQERITRVEDSCKSEHKRLDRVERFLDLQKKEDDIDE